MKQLQRVWDKLREESGQMLVLMGLAMVVLCGSIGVTFDIADAYIGKQNLQAATDAGALAGAQALEQGQSSSNVTSTAETTAEKNVADADYTVQVVGSNEVTITAQEKMSTYFAAVLGIRHITINVKSTAGVAPPTTATSGVVPISVVPQGWTIGQSYNLTFGSGSGNSGNFGFLNFNGSGVNHYGVSVPVTDQGDNALNWYIQNGAPFPIQVGEQIPTETGLGVGQVNTAISNMPNVSIIPIVDTIDLTGTKNSKVIGFAVFHITGYNQSDQVVTGTYLGQLINGMSNPNIATTNYGAETVELLK